MLKVETDHKSLESILKKSLWSAPRRLQRIMLCLQNFDLEVEYEKGALVHVADSISRAHVPRTQARGKTDVFLQQMLDFPESKLRFHYSLRPGQSAASNRGRQWNGGSKDHD